MMWDGGRPKRRRRAGPTPRGQNFGRQGREGYPRLDARLPPPDLMSRGRRLSKGATALDSPYARPAVP